MPRASMALMVVPSTRMPAQDGMATPLKGGREGIVGTSGRHPEASEPRYLGYLWLYDNILNLLGMICLNLCGLILLISCVSFTTAQRSWCTDRDALKLLK
jgi:hypothetical protein